MCKCVRVVLGIALACFILTTAAMAATESDKLTAIQNGLANLASLQLADGSWDYGGYNQAVTGVAALAFLSQKDKWPGSKSAAYQLVADKAIAYLLANATTNPVQYRDDHVDICPGGGPCLGVYWYGAGESIYTTGHVAPAIAYYGSSNPNAVATLTGPLANKTGPRSHRASPTNFQQARTPH